MTRISQALEQRLRWAGAAGAFLLLAVAAHAGPTSVNTSVGLTAEGAPLALHGYDAVAYFADGAAILGVSGHAQVHGGATYRFASREHLEAFQAAPEKYLPAFGGFCAYGVSIGAKFDGDPRVWKIVDGKLYLNLSPEIMELWQEDIPGNLEKAEARWPKIADQSPDALAEGN